MITMSPSAEYKISLLQKAIIELYKEISVFETGIDEEMKEIDLIRAYSYSIYEAIDHAKYSSNTVSIEEYKNMLEDLKKIKDLMDKKNESLKILHETLKIKKRHAESIQATIKQIIEENQIGKILEFKTKEKE